MGFGDFYKNGLAIPGYSKRAIHTKRYGDIFIGADTPTDAQMAEARVKLLTEVKSHGATAAKPFYVSRVFNDLTTSSLDWDSQDLADGDLESASKDDLVLVAAEIDAKAHKAINQKAGTLIVTPDAPKSDSKKSDLLKAGAGLLAALGLLLLMGKH